MGIHEKLLNKSNSYIYYKENYEKLKKSQKKLKDEKQQLISKYNSVNDENDFLKSKLTKNNEEIVKLQKRLGEYTKPDIINKLINKQYSDLTICIKSPNPKGQHHWGDYFFSIALKKSFLKKGFNVLIQEREEWYDSDVKADINIVLRGLVEYKPNFDEINLMWNISHPELVTDEEYELYDICFISSEKYAGKLDNQISTTVKPLLQCTDPEVFFPEKEENIAEDILFIGITRGVYREIIKDIMQTDFPVSIYGMGWEKFVDEKYIKGQFVPNSELHKYYSSCKILLNDHWEDMRDMDFPSNRLFDALACETFVISDKIPSATTLFEGTIVTYDGIDDLNKKLEYYLTHDEERRRLAQEGRQIVLNNHTFDNRAERILNCLKDINLNRAISNLKDLNHKKK